MYRTFLLAALFFCAAKSSAQDSSTVLDEVTVTANKYPQKLAETAKVITVITEKDLEQMAARNIGEILNTIAGVHVSGANGAPGTNMGVGLRGSSFGNVLILIDGMPVTDPSLITTYFDLNFIQTAQIERVEILKGSQSTLYGADAVAGVINFITKKSGQKPLSFFGEIKAGSYRTAEATAGVHGVLKKFYYNIQNTGLYSDGFSSAHDALHTKAFDRDGLKQYSLRSTLGYVLSPHSRVQAFAQYSRYRAQVDAGSFKDDKDFFIRNINKEWGAQYNRNKGNKRLVAQYHNTNITRHYLDDSSDRGDAFAYFVESDYKGRMHFAEAYHSWQWAQVQLLTGLDFRAQQTAQDYFSVSSYGPFATPHFTGRMQQWSPYASVQYKHQKWNIEAGGRWNRHNTYGNHFTWSLHPSFSISNRLKLFAGAASAFKAPSLYQLFDAYAGNKNLHPETSRTWEGGIALQASQALQARATFFYRTIENAIQYITTDITTYAGQYRNITEQKSKGIETELHYTKAKWNLHANYTFLKGHARSAYTEGGMPLAKDTTYNNLYRAPKHSFNLRAGYGVSKKFGLNTVFRALGKRLEAVYGAAPVALAAYYTVDLGASYQLEKIRFYADVRNLTNQRYFDLLGYNSRRINFMLGARYGF